MEEIRQNIEIMKNDYAMLEAENNRMRKALIEIASETKVYKGHGDYDIVPAFNEEDAQAIARDALQES